ncbi:hypothetical protein JXA88_11965 [Candidatus Fermentibacteria bacterium]|nr:hypothetical protein [Candidatus Fermentibacteria bacterium]
MDDLRKIPRPVALLFSVDHAAWIAGVPASHAFHSPTRMASVVLYAHAVYGHDLVVVHSDAFILLEALGGECAYSDAGPPVLIRRPPAESERPIDPERDGRIPLLLEAASLVRRHLSGMSAVAVSITGPLTLAAGVVGEAGFLASLGSMTAQYRTVLACAEETVANIARAARREGMLVMLAEPLAGMLSPSLFEAEAAPTLRRILADAEAIVHICGDCSHLLPLLPAVGASAFSLDDVDIGAASRTLLDTTMLMGGVTPFAIREGPPERVRVLAREACATGSGLVPCSGCDLVWDTPRENARAFVQGARDATSNQGEPDRPLATR